MPVPTTILPSDSYFLAHDGAKVFVPGYALAGSEVSTGQPYLELFVTLAELNARLVALGQLPLDYDPAAPPA